MRKQIKPAVRTKRGIVPGKPTDKHKDIPATGQRGFVADGKFMTRAQTSRFIKKSDPAIFDRLPPKGKRKLHTSNLRKAKDQRNAPI